MLCTSLLTILYPFGSIYKPNQFKWLNDLLLFSYDKDFAYHMRLPRSELGLLCNVLHNRWERFFINNSYNPKSPISKQLAMFLHCFCFYGNEAGFRNSVGIMLDARRRLSYAIFFCPTSTSSERITIDLSCYAMRLGITTDFDTVLFP